MHLFIVKPLQRFNTYCVKKINDACIYAHTKNENAKFVFISIFY
jgi:hypothetical protein